MKKRYLILFIVLLIISAGFVLLRSISKPLTKEEAITQIQSTLNKAVEENHITGVVLTLHSDRNKFSKTFTSGSTGSEKDNIAVNDQYHSASVGKTFTATVIGILEMNKILSSKDKISDYLSDETLKNFFIVDGIDYKEDVLIEQLLNHTSGIGDYFEDPVSEGLSMKELVISEPEHLWTPDELIDFTRERQKAVGKPGETFHYSDTGYVLLGLIIEKATGESYHQYLKRKILKPLGMNDTYVMFKNTGKKGKILEMWMEGVDVSKSNALSIDWTGGGIVTTTSDLLKFYKALNNGKLIREDILNRMTNFNNEYLKGVHYGSGMMQFRFDEFSPLLKGMGNIHGGVGASSSFMMYDPLNDIYIIANFGSFDFMENSVIELIKVLQIYSRTVI